MPVNYTSARTFSDMAASYAALAESVGRLELKLKFRQGHGQAKAAAKPQIRPNMLPLFFAVLWGVGLFGVLEIDAWAAKATIIALMAMASFGLDLMFYSR